MTSVTCVTVADDDGGPAAAVPGGIEPPRLVCASAGDGYDPTGVAASWQAPAFVGGAPIEGYDVQYQPRIADGDPWVWGQWQPWPHTGTATTTTIAGLDPETLYGVRVRADNASGPGQWSLPSTFWTGEPDQICDILDRSAEARDAAGQRVMRLHLPSPWARRMSHARLRALGGRWPL